MRPGWVGRPDQLVIQLWWWKKLSGPTGIAIHLLEELPPTETYPEDLACLDIQGVAAVRGQLHMPKPSSFGQRKSVLHYPGPNHVFWWGCALELREEMKLLCQDMQLMKPFLLSGMALCQRDPWPCSQRRDSHPLNAQPAYFNCPLLKSATMKAECRGTN